jgi:hypothetical protein
MPAEYTDLADELKRNRLRPVRELPAKGGYAAIARPGTRLKIVFMRPSEVRLNIVAFAVPID